MKISFLPCACALALAATSAAAIDVVLVPSPSSPDLYTGEFAASFFTAGQHIPTREFVSPVPGTLSFELFDLFRVGLIGYQFDRGPVISFTTFNGALVTGIPITSGPHELLVGYQAAPEVPPRTPATGGFSGTLTVVSASRSWTHGYC